MDTGGDDALSDRGMIILELSQSSSPVVKWHIFTQACFAVWTMFYD